LTTLSVASLYIVEQIDNKDDLEKDFEGNGSGTIEMIFRNLPRGTEENNEKFQ
jgi:hypothetical protein